MKAKSDYYAPVTINFTEVIYLPWVGLSELDDPLHDPDINHYFVNLQKQREGHQLELALQSQMCSIILFRDDPSFLPVSVSLRRIIAASY